MFGPKQVDILSFNLLGINYVVISRNKKIKNNDQ